jgi:hypothetical protein
VASTPGLDPGAIAFQRPVEEGLHLVVDLDTQTRYLALGYAGHSHGLHQVIDRTRGDALYIGFLDHCGEGLLGHPPWLKEAREIAALPQPRDAKFDGSGTGLPIAFTVAVAMCQTVGGTGTVGSTGAALDLQFHQALGAEADHLAQEVGVGGLLQQATEVHVLVGHCRVLGRR